MDRLSIPELKWEFVYSTKPNWNGTRIEFDWFESVSNAVKSRLELENATNKSDYFLINTTRDYDASIWAIRMLTKYNTYESYADGPFTAFDHKNLEFTEFKFNISTHKFSESQISKSKSSTFTSGHKFEACK
ncbi:MAG: hypothetical protein PHY93_10855 [Bacteriovorax sp.]|nr:hypothetical protein [Bacteriovorax sp.]